MFKQVLRTFLYTLLFLGAFSVYIEPVSAEEPPTTIRFELTLSNDAGVLEGPKRVDIQLRSDEDVQWSETHFNVPFVEGQATLILGSSSYLTPNAFDISTPNFAILVEGDEVSINVHAVPYAIRAYSAEYVSWNNILGAPDFFDASSDLEVNSLSVSTDFFVTGNGDIGGDLDVSENLSATTLSVTSIYLGGELLDPNLTNAKTSAFAALTTENANFIVSDGTNWIVVSRNQALTYLNTKRIDISTPTLNSLVVMEHAAIDTVGIFQVNTSDIVVTLNRVGIGTTVPSGAFQVDTYDTTEAAYVPTLLVSNNTVLVGTDNYNAAIGAQLFVEGDMRVSGDIYGRIVASEIFDTDFDMNTDSATNPIAYRKSGSLGLGVGETVETTARLEITDVNDAGSHAYRAYVRVHDITEGDDFFVVDTAGNTGIGLLYPSANLHVSGNAPLIVESELTPNALVVSTNGFVGIGTHLPQVALEVSGNVSANQLLAASLLANSAIFSDIVTINVLIPSSHIELGPTSHIQLANGGTLNTLHSYLTTNVGTLHIVTENLDDEFVTYNMMQRMLTLDNRSTLNVVSGSIIIGDEGAITLRDDATFYGLGDGVSVSDGLLQIAGADDFVTYLVEGKEISFNAYTTVNITSGNLIVTDDSHLTIAKSSVHLTENSTLYIDENSGIFLYGETVSFNALAGNITINSLSELDLNISSLNAAYWNVTEDATTLIITGNSTLSITTSDFTIQDSDFWVLDSDVYISNNVGLIVSDNTVVTLGATASLIATDGARIELGSTSYLHLHEQTDGFNALGSGLAIENNALTINLSVINTLNDDTFVQFDVVQRSITLNNYSTLNVVNSFIYASQNAQALFEGSDITLTKNAGLILGNNSGIVLYESTSSFNRLGTSLSIDDRVLDLNIASMNLAYLNTTESASIVTITDNSTLLLSESNFIINDATITLTKNTGLLITNNSTVTFGALAELIVTEGAVLTIGSSGMITFNNIPGFNGFGDGFLVDANTLTLNSVVIRDVLVGEYVPFEVESSTITLNASSLYLTGSNLFVSANSAASITENSALTIGKGSTLNLTANATVIVGSGAGIKLSDSDNTFNSLGEGLSIDSDALTLNSSYLDAVYAHRIIDNDTFIITNSATLLVTENSAITIGRGSTLNLTQNATVVVGIDSLLHLTNVGSGFNTLGEGVSIENNALTLNSTYLDAVYAHRIIDNDTFIITNSATLLVTENSAITIGRGSTLNLTQNATVVVGIDSLLHLTNVGSGFNTLGEGVSIENNALTLNSTYLDAVYAKRFIDADSFTVTNDSLILVTENSAITIGRGSTLNITQNATIVVGIDAGISLAGLDETFNTIGNGLTVGSSALSVLLSNSSGLESGLQFDGSNQLELAIDSTSPLEIDTTNGLRFKVDDGLTIDSGDSYNLKVEAKSLGGLGVDASGVYANLGDGLASDSGSIELQLNNDSGITYESGLSFTSGLLHILHNPAGPITLNANGLSVSTNYKGGLDADANGIYVNTGTGMTIDEASNTIMVDLLDSNSGLEFSSSELRIRLDDSNAHPFVLNSTGLNMRIDTVAEDNGLEYISDSDLGGLTALAVKVDETNSPIRLTSDGLSFDIAAGGPLLNTTGVGLSLALSHGIAINGSDSNGLMVDLDGTDSGLSVDTNGLKVLTQSGGGVASGTSGLYVDLAPYLDYQITEGISKGLVGIGQTWFYDYKTIINTGGDYNASTATYNQVIIGLQTGAGDTRTVADGVRFRVYDDTTNPGILDIKSEVRSPVSAARDTWVIAPELDTTPLVLGLADGDVYLGELSSGAFTLTLNDGNVGILNATPDAAVDITLPASDMFRIDGASEYAFIVQNDGKVGIGTSAPEETLSILNGNTRIANPGAMALTVTGDVFVQESLNIRTETSAAASEFGFYNYDNVSGVHNATSMRVVYDDDLAEMYDKTNTLTDVKALTFNSYDYDGTSVSPNIFVLTQDGRVGIGTTHFYEHNTILSVTGNVRVSGDMRISGVINSTSIASLEGDFTGTLIAANMPGFSDRRLKDTITPLSNAVSLIQQLQGVSFIWNDDSKDFKDFPTGTQYGFIAQEVKEILPSIVGEHNGYLNVNYDAFIALLTEALKEQQQQLESQEARIENLESLLKKLSEDIEQLKSERGKDTR